MSQNGFIFDITVLPNRDVYDLKFTSVVGADLVKLDYNKGCCTLSTSKQTEEVVILYELSQHNLKPPQEDQDDNKDHEESSTSAGVESLKMVIAIKNQGNEPTSETNSGAYIANPISVWTPDIVASDGTGITNNNTTSSSSHLRSHKKHDMTLINGDLSPYNCSGCKELGFGDRYKCVHEECAHILHPDCRFYNENATHEFLNGSTFNFESNNENATHEFFNGLTFNFFEEHFGGKRRYCDACGIGIKGYFYYCNETSKNLHPCCLNLKKTVQVGEMKFQLCEKMTSKCLYCKSKKKRSKGKYWCYSSESHDSQAHVSCMKNTLLTCLKDESTMASIKRKVADLLEWAKLLLKKITQFLKADKECLEKIIPKLKKAESLLDRIIIPSLELAKKTLEKTPYPFLGYAVYVEFITRALKALSSILKLALSISPAPSEDPVQCTPSFNQRLESSTDQFLSLIDNWKEMHTDKNSVWNSQDVSEFHEAMLRLKPRSSENTSEDEILEEVLETRRGHNGGRGRKLSMTSTSSLPTSSSGPRMSTDDVVKNRVQEEMSKYFQALQAANPDLVFPKFQNVDDDKEE